MPHEMEGQFIAEYHEDAALAPSAPDGTYHLDVPFALQTQTSLLLVFSRPGMLKLLPALPGAWRRGSARGIACRGEIVVDLAWHQADRRLRATLTAQSAQRVTVKFPARVDTLQAEAEVLPSPHGAAYRAIDLPPGQPVTLDGTLELPE